MAVKSLGYEQPSWERSAMRKPFRLESTPRSRSEGAPGDTMTLIGACRDALRVIRTEPGAQPEELKPALDEVEILSGKLEEVWPPLLLDSLYNVLTCRSLI